MKRIAGIYKITSPTGKVYIGKSFYIKQRWTSHRYAAKSNFSYPLYNSFKKHGIDKHVFEIIHELPKDCEESVFVKYEQLYMDLYKECGLELLNINPAAGSRFGTTHSAEARAKISKIHKGRRFSDEHRAKISESNRRRTISEESKEKNRQSQKRRPVQRTTGFTGRSHTEETKRKIALAWTGRKHTEETKKRMALVATGRTPTEETRRKLSIAALIRQQKKRENGISQ